jgi:hypothetical protein
MVNYSRFSEDEIQAAATSIIGSAAPASGDDVDTRAPRIARSLAPLAVQ